MSRVKFGDVVKDVKINIDRLNNPYEYYVAGDHMDSEDLTIHRKGCFTTDDVGPAFIRVFKPGQILYGSRRTYLKKIAVADFEGVCANTTFVFETKDPHAFEQRLLPFIMLSKDFTTWSIAKSKGSTNPYVLFSDLADFEFELPPLEEQKVLVDKLWAAYRLKEAYKKLLVATDEMVKSQFIEMYYNTHNKQTLESVCPIMSKGITPKYVESSSVLVINQACIHWDGQRLGNIKYHNEEIPVRKRILESGDVLLNATGNGTLGRCCVFICPSDNNTYINDGHVIALSTDRAVILPEVLNTYLSLNDTQAEIYRQYVTGSTNQVDIVFSDIKKMKVPVPSMDEQILFVEVLKQADKSKFGDFKSQFIEMFGNPLSLNQKNELKRLGECCILNPRRPNIALCDTDKVSFIPMPAVSEDGYLVDMTDEEYGKVKKGFTYFENNDVLFAKITPCMENGKGAIVHGLTNGIGMGSTEFHVLRPINGISSPYWLLALTRMPIFRERAAKNMSGTGGQKRVSASYLDHFMVGLPAMEEQRRFEAIYRQADKSKFGDFKSQFIEMFGNPVTNTKGWKTAKIKDVAPEMPSKEQLSGKIWLLNLDMIESNTGRIIEKVYEDVENALSVQSFDEGNVLFSKLRPYLNKVVIPDEPGMATTELVPLRPEPSKLHKVFLSHLLRGNQFVNYANDIAGGTKMPRMPLTELRNFDCILPPMDKQLEFVFIAEQVDKSKFELKQCIENIDKVIKSLING